MQLISKKKNGIENRESINQLADSGGLEHEKNICYFCIQNPKAFEHRQQSTGTEIYLQKLRLSHQINYFVLIIFFLSHGPIRII